MKLRSQTVRTTLALMVIGMAGLLGCSDDGLGKRYSVSGKVTYKGQPLEKGLISFISSAPDGRSASGTIENGNYTLTTQDPGDGAFAGQYIVTIASRNADFTEAADKAKAKGNTSSYIPQDFTAEANKKAKNAVPDKYSVPTSSPLKAEVKAQSNKDMNFDLVD